MKSGIGTAKFLCAAFISAFGGLGVTSAQAVPYNWSFVCDIGASCSGSGTLETDIAIGPATVTSFLGTFGGLTVTSLLAPGTIGGNTNKIFALSPGTAFDAAGIGFATSASNWRLYYSNPLASVRLLGQGGFVTTGAFTVSEAVSETPIPAALPLFATGLGALGLIAYRKKRKQAA